MGKYRKSKNNCKRKSRRSRCNCDRSGCQRPCNNFRGNNNALNYNRGLNGNEFLQIPPQGILPPGIQSACTDKCNQKYETCSGGGCYLLWIRCMSGCLYKP